MHNPFCIHQARNDNWTYESGRANSAAAEGKRVYYEVLLMSSGIVQVIYASVVGNIQLAVY